MGRGRPRKDKFDDLEQEWKDAIVAATTEGVKKTVADLALNYESLMIAKKEDGDLAEKAEAYASANEVYKEGRKAYKLRMAFIRQVLTDRGIE